MVQITLPDGSLREFPGPVTVAEVAASIGSGLAKAALGGKVNGQLVDTSFSMAANAQLAIVTAKDPEGLELIRHSTAHLLAYAVKELFPEAQVTIGPVIENGFYYDFSYSRPFTPEDLVAIEKRMTELSNKDEAVVRRVLPRGIWAGLFSLPVFDDEAALLSACPKAQEALYIEPWKHVLTHRDLHLHPVRLQLAPGHAPQCEGQWVDASDWPALGLPAPIRLLLEGSKG